MSNNILVVRNLKKYFPSRSDFWGRPAVYVKAVDDISFSVRRGETLGLVGESGCGKSTTGRTIINLYQPTAGEILFNGRSTASQTAQKQLRQSMQMIFQDPYASLNPRLTVGGIIDEPLVIHHPAPKAERLDRISELLKLVGLAPEYIGRFPHEFSGGQRQRIGIARALAVNPQLIICDEPISALDVSIQAQIVNLLERLQAELGLTYLFIAHDLAMVKHISTRIAVMYLGRIVEIAGSAELYSRPQHPYTQALLSAIPIPDPAAQSRRQPVRLCGDPPNPINLPVGCRFRPRCSQAMKICAAAEPALQDTGTAHYTACHLHS